MKSALYEMTAADAERFEALARWAEATDDGELADFFERVSDEESRRAEDARRLLAQRVAE